MQSARETNVFVYCRGPPPDPQHKYNCGIDVMQHPVHPLNYNPKPLSPTHTQGSSCLFAAWTEGCSTYAHFATKCPDSHPHYNPNFNVVDVTKGKP